MNLFPPMPSWDGLHPLIVHFPIALLLVAPVLVLVSLFVKQSRPWAVAALVLMVLGTVAAFVAVSTGGAAGELAEKAGATIERVVERHEEMAETTRNVFSALTLLFAALVVVPAFVKRPLAQGVRVTATLIFLALYAGGSLLLVNTAHQGGRLVHEFGVRAAVAPTPGEPTAKALDAAQPAGATGEKAEAGERGERGEDRD